MAIIIIFTYHISGTVHTEPYGTVPTENEPFQCVLLFVIVAESTSVEAVAARSLKEKCFQNTLVLTNQIPTLITDRE
jgi:hypothetical protein